MSRIGNSKMRSGACREGAACTPARAMKARGANSASEAHASTEGSASESEAHSHGVKRERDRA